MNGHSRLNIIFRDMKRRCTNSNDRNYVNYGAKGISVCAEWSSTEKIGKGRYGNNCTLGFIAFKEWAMKNGYEDNLTLDRIDVNKGYSPDNCRWADRRTQNNNKRSNHYITYKGRKQTLAQWCNELGLKYDTVKTRINTCHWSIERAFEKR